MSLLSDLSGVVDPECSDNSNEGSMQVNFLFNGREFFEILFSRKNSKFKSSESFVVELGLDIQLKFIKFIDFKIIYFIKICAPHKYRTNASLFATEFHLSTIVGE